MVTTPLCKSLNQAPWSRVAMASLLSAALVGAPVTINFAELTVGSASAFAKGGGGGGGGGHGGGGGSHGGGSHGGGNHGSASGRGAASAHGQSAKGHASTHASARSPSAFGISADDHGMYGTSPSATAHARTARNTARAARPSKPAHLDGALNAAHASTTALDNAAPNSQVGKIASYKANVQSYQSALAANDPVAAQAALDAAGTSLADAANKSVTTSTVSSLNSQLGLSTTPAQTAAISTAAQKSP